MNAAVARPGSSTVARRVRDGESFQVTPSPSRTWVLVVVVGLVAATWLALLAPTGVLQAGPDSVAYVGAARNIVDGRGITMPFVQESTDDRPIKEASYDGRVPLYQYSPGLPLMLAGLLAVGLGATAAASVVYFLSIAVTGAVLSWLTLRLTRGSWTAAVVVPLVFLTTAEYVVLLKHVMSEVPFIALVLGALALLARYVSKRTIGSAVAFVAVAAAASLTRFVGVAVIATGIVAIAAWSGGSLGRRLRRAAAVGACALAPLVVWMLHDALGASGGAGDLSYHPPKHFFGYLSKYASAYVDPRYRFHSALKYVVAFAVLALVVAGVMLAVRASPVLRGGASFDGSLARVAATFLVLYPAAQLTTMTFFHGAPFRGRYVLPVAPLVYAFAAVALVAAVRRVGWPRVAVVPLVVLFAAVVVVRHGVAAPDYWRNLHAVREAAPPRPGSVLVALRKLPGDTIVFTNTPATVYDATRLFAIGLPVPTSIWTEEPIPEHHQDVIDVGRVLCAKPAVLAIVGASGHQAGVARLAATWERRAHLVTVRTYDDGAVLRADPSACTGT